MASFCDLLEASGVEDDMLDVVVLEEEEEETKADADDDRSIGATRSDLVVCRR